MNNSYYNGENNNQYGYYQNMYNVFGGYNPIVEKQSSNLRKLGMKIGATLLCFTALQYVLSLVLALTGWGDAVFNDSVLNWGVSSIFQLIYIVLPFAVLFLTLGEEKSQIIEMYEKPKKTTLYVLGVFAGLMICLVGDMVSSYVTAIFEMFGTDFYNSDMSIPTNVPGVIVFVLGCAVMPALVEEFAFRGVILTSLRKYGNKFAIVSSAILFAIMHGNMIQIPFAFIAGLALGYFMISTGSIWTSVTIHFLNNLISVIFSVYYELNPNATNIPYFICTSVIVIVGIAAAVLWIIGDRKKPAARRMELTSRTAYDVFLTVPTVVACIFIAISSSVSQSELTSGFGTLSLIAVVVLISALLMRMIKRIARDSRIKYNSVYTLSKVIIVASDIFIIIGILAAGVGAVN